MSTDANDKAHSKFPRASLRARNRTIIMAPADVEDFRPEPRKTKSNIRIEDLLEDVTAGQGSSASALDSVLSDVFSDPPAAEPEHGLIDTSPTDGVTEENPLSSLDVDTAADALSLLDDQPETESFEPSFSEPETVEDQPETFQTPEEQIEHVAPMARIVRAAETNAFRSEPPAPVPEQEEVEESVQKVEHDVVMEADAPRPPVSTPTAASSRSCASNQPAEYVDEQAREYIEWQRPSKLLGFLVSFEVERLGKYVELREGRMLVSCERNASDNCLVIAHPSVSLMHAIVRVSSDGSILILDQLSEHGTRIKRCSSGKEETLLGDKSNLEHGDMVIFGECAYHVCIIKGT